MSDQPLASTDGPSTSTKPTPPSSTTSQNPAAQPVTLPAEFPGRFAYATRLSPLSALPDTNRSFRFSP